MDLVQQLPRDIASKICFYFRHPNADLIETYWQQKPYKDALRDLCNYVKTYDKLFTTHRRAENEMHLILNDLWIHTTIIFGSGRYFQVWKRLYRSYRWKDERVRRWYSQRMACCSTINQIRTLWALFTENERQHFLELPYGWGLNNN